MAIEHKFPKAPAWHHICYFILPAEVEFASRQGRSPTISACEGRNPALDEKFQA